MKTNWRISEQAPHEIRGTDNGNCDVLVARVWGGSAEEIDEHAGLIVAAPDLLRELRHMVEAVECDMDTVRPEITMSAFGHLDTARAAIAKSKKE